MVICRVNIFKTCFVLHQAHRASEWSDDGTEKRLTGPSPWQTVAFRFGISWIPSFKENADERSQGTAEESWGELLGDVCMDPVKANSLSLEEFCVTGLPSCPPTNFILCLGTTIHYFYLCSFFFLNGFTLEQISAILIQTLLGNFEALFTYVW